MNIELKLGMDVCFGRIQLMVKNDGIKACQFFPKIFFRNFFMGIHPKIQKNGHILKTKPTIILKFFPEVHYSVTNRWWKNLRWVFFYNNVFLSSVLSSISTQMSTKLWKYFKPLDANDEKIDILLNFRKAFNIFKDLWAFERPSVSTALCILWTISMFELLKKVDSPFWTN